MCFALFMIMLDNTVVNVALPSIQRDLHASISGARVDGQRLHADLRRAARHRRPPGRHLRPPPVFLFGVVVFARLERASSASRRRDDVARRRPRGPGHRRRVHDARRRCRSSPTRSRRTSAARRSAPGPASRRSRWRSARVVGGFLVEHVSLAGDLLHQRPGRRRRRRRRRCSPRTSRATRPSSASVDIPGIATLTVGLDRARARARRGQRLGLGLAADHRRCSPLAVVGLAALRGHRARAPRADGRLRVLPLALVPGREPRRLHRHVRDARDVLLPRALHAEHPRLLAARGRRALPARRRS